MNDGTMQSYALTLDKFLDHAAKWHPRAEVVAGRPDGTIDRIDYRTRGLRARRLSFVLAGLGVSVGSRVATLAWNSQGHVEAWYAIAGMGAVCHTLNPRLNAGQLGEILKQSAAKVAIVSADLLPLLHECLTFPTKVEHVLVIDGAPQELTSHDATYSVQALAPLLDAAGPGFDWGGFDETIPSGLCFTSGTTGAPKGVTYTHRSTYLHTLRLLQADVIGITKDDAVLSVVPMFHANAWGLPFAAPAVGAKLVLPGRHADGASLARLIGAENVTIAAGVPTVWLGLVEHLETTGGDVPSLKRILVGGAPMPPALMRRIEDRLGATIQTSWGMTELSPLGTIAAPAEPVRDPALSGRPALGIDLRLTDAEGNTLPEQRGTEGHLKVRGPAVVDRYFGQADSATDVDGWFDTGDLARIDEAGNLTITGRAKDLIKSGGEWINPAKIEAIVSALPEVSLAAVIGRPDSKWGERPVLVVELRKRQEITDQRVLDALHGRVAAWWIPDLVVRVAAMPLAATGKIDKSRLRAEYAHA